MYGEKRVTISGRGRMEIRSQFQLDYVCASDEFHRITHAKHERERR